MNLKVKISVNIFKTESWKIEFCKQNLTIVTCKAQFNISSISCIIVNPLYIPGVINIGAIFSITGKVSFENIFDNIPFWSNNPTSLPSCQPWSNVGPDSDFPPYILGSEPYHWSYQQCCYDQWCSNQMSVNFKKTFWCLRFDQKINKRNSALAFKKMSYQKNKGTLYH